VYRYFFGETIMNTEDLTITIPIASTFRQQAKQFAAEQTTPQKQQRVKNTTLVVLAAAEYLQWQGYNVQLENSQCYDRLTRTLSDVADVFVGNIGRIECLVAEPSAGTCAIPPEAQQERIGYLVTSLEDKQVRLLGFAPMFDPEDVPDELELNELESLEAMVDYFDRLERGNAELMTEDENRRLMLVAMLERIYRQEKPNRWGIKAEQVLSDRQGELAMMREADSPTDLVARQEKAEAVMQRLAKLWKT
jgi:Protein of unknown function (DUF1822)